MPWTLFSKQKQEEEKLPVDDAVKRVRESMIYLTKSLDELDNILKQPCKEKHCAKRRTKKTDGK